MKKIICMLLLCTMVVTSMAGCGGKETASKNGGNIKCLNTESEFPIVKEEITLKVASKASSKVANAHDTWFWNWLEAKSGMKFDVELFDDATWTEKKSILFAADELPDFFLYCSFSAEDTVKYGQEEKLLAPLNKYVDYAPKLKAELERNDVLRSYITCNDGNIYSLPSYDVEASDTFRCWINEEWVKKLGLKTPETLDEFYNVLKAFRDGDPNGNGVKDEIPLSGIWKAGYPMRCIPLQALGFASGYDLEPCIKDGKVAIAEGDKLFAEYLKYMNKLFTEGLIDKDVFTQTTAQADGKAKQNKCGVVFAGAPFLITQNENDWQQYQSLTPLTSEWNKEKLWTAPPYAHINKFLMSAKCEYPEAVMRMMDIFFDGDNSAVKFTYGPMAGTEDVMGYKSWFINDENVVDYKDADAGSPNAEKELLPGAGTPVGLIYSDESMKKVTGKEIKDDFSNAFWKKTFNERVAPYCKVENKYPTVYFTSEQMSEIAKLKTAIGDYCTMMEAKFITGVEPLTNIDKYYAELENLGFSKLLTIYQDAYTKYQANLNK